MKGPIPDQLYTDPCDLDLDECMMEEYYYSTFPRPPFHILNQTINLNIYGEPATLADEDAAYTTLTPPIPIFVQLSPHDEDLNRYGYDRKREAIAWFSTKILRDRGIQPKVGDRIDCIYKDALNNQVLEHFIINELTPMEFLRQSLTPYQYNAALDKTQKAKQP